MHVANKLVTECHLFISATLHSFHFNNTMIDE